MRKSVKERQLENEERADTPTVRALYEVILELTNKMTTMERQIKELSKLADYKKRKINILDWLNETQQPDNETAIEDFIVRLRVERKHLEHLFQHDYPSAVLQVLQEALPLNLGGCESHIIKAFDQKTNVLFVYSKTEAQWIIMPEQIFKTLLHQLDKQILAAFVNWQKENTAKMEQDDFAMKYAQNVKKVMGGNLSRDQIYSRIKIDLYKYLKVGAKNITEYEFV
jgi:uncharacterized protein (DUF2267 family)